MNYTNEQVEGILNRVWEDRLKGGGWKDRETFINTMMQVKNLPIADVVVPFVCRDCDKPTKEYRDNLCEPCHKWHTDS